MSEPDLDSMSEVERILFVFDEAIRIETESAGNAPCACIMGHESFNSFLAAIKIASSNMQMFPCESDYVCYKGVTIYCSHAIADGLVMGHLPPKPVKEENN